MKTLRKNALLLAMLIVSPVLTVSATNQQVTLADCSLSNKDLVTKFYGHDKNTMVYTQSGQENILATIANGLREQAPKAESKETPKNDANQKKDPQDPKAQGRMGWMFDTVAAPFVYGYESVKAHPWKSGAAAAVLVAAGLDHQFGKQFVKQALVWSTYSGEELRYVPGKVAAAYNKLPSMPNVPYFGAVAKAANKAAAEAAANASMFGNVTATEATLGAAGTAATLVAGKFAKPFVVARALVAQATATTAVTTAGAAVKAAFAKLVTKAAPAAVAATTAATTAAVTTAVVAGA